MYIKTIFLFLLLALILNCYCLAEEDFVLKVVNVKGDVQIFDLEKNAWNAIRAPYKLNKNDKIKTFKASSCEIKLNSSRLKIEENSEVSVKSLLEKIALDLSYGEILIKLKELPADSSFVIETPQAIAGARGTRYKVSVVKENSLTEVSVFRKSVRLKSKKEPFKSVVVTEYQRRQICPWQITLLRAEGAGILSEEILGSGITKKRQTSRMDKINENEYIKIYGALAKVSTKRAAVTDAHRKLAEKIYGIVIDSETTLENYAITNDTIRTTVKGLVKGAREIDTTYFSDGSIKVLMETEGKRIKEGLTSITGDIYGIDCISGPDILETADFEDFLL